MALEPVDYDIEPSQGTLKLIWSDGRSTLHSMNDLRRECPCATCRQERDKIKSSMGLRVLSGPTTVQQAVILKIHPVGRYALRFDWNDQHSTGIYSYEFLLEHSQPAE